MGLTTLVCPCGRRLRTAGKATGESGRCPACGRTLRVPETAAVAVAVEEDEWNWRGSYELGAEPPARKPEAVQATAEARGAVEESEPRSPLAARGRRERRESEWDEPQRLEGWFPPHLLYPSRGAEGLSMVAVIGGAGWVMGTLASEYCLAILADGDLMGVPSLGRLIALVSALPVMILSPLVVMYAFQCLSRVLVATSDGEHLPPRPPDRNADGLLDGVGAWLRWVVLGGGVGLLPLAAYRMAMGESWNTTVAVALGLAAIPYALMALLMAFLHDDDLAARPWAVVAAMAKVGPSFLGLTLTVVGLLVPVGLAFAAALALREPAYWLYLTASLGCWLLAAWLPIVAMHTLGAYHAPRKGRLKWRRKRRRWGAS